MRQVVPNVYLIEGLRTSNVYVLTSADGLALVDTGSPGDGGKIVSQLEEGGHTLSDLKTILLTHYHGDHVGNVAALVAHSGAWVMAHAEDVPYIEQSASLPASSAWRRVLNWMMDKLMPTSPCEVNNALDDGDVVATLGGLHVIHVPGHTPGSIVFYQPERQLLFCGDVLFNGNPFTGRGDLQMPPRFFSMDPDQAKASVRKLADLSVEVICFGHGAPLREDAQAALKRIAQV
jgi:glyoxylase-like metal-dependent hydrolase (beta-lactamase superfamily II)